MKPRQFFDEICVPSVNDFAVEPTSLRRAWVAVIALFHFSDYVAGGSRGTLKAVIKNFCQEFPKYDLAVDLANASKHFELDVGARKGLSVQHLEVGPEAAFTDNTYYDDGTSHSDAGDVIRVKFGNELVDVVHLCASLYLTYPASIPMFRASNKV